MSGGPPELGPLLGRLADPAPRGPEELPLDDLRMDLLSALYAAAGRARAAWQAGQGGEAWRALGPEVWSAAWREASAGAADRCLATVDELFARAAARANMSAARLASHIPGEADRRTFRTKCDSAGIPLERLGPLDESGDPEAWLLQAAMALDDSWERLERVVLAELASWKPAVAAVSAWRRPRGPLWTVTAAVLMLALGLGLSIGGYLPAPGPLGLLRDWWWSLPWP